MSQAGIVNSSGGGGGGNTVSAGLGINVVQSGSDFLVSNTGIINYYSPLIDFNVVSATKIFTSQTGHTFNIQGYAKVSAVATAAVYAANFNLGWTPAAFSDIVFQDIFDPGVTPGTPAPSFKFASTETLGGSFSSVPSNTDFFINVTSPDTGTVMTGYIVIQGFYI